MFEIQSISVDTKNSMETVDSTFYIIINVVYLIVCEIIKL